jgi:hypothetical protein
VKGRIRWCFHEEVIYKVEKALDMIMGKGAFLGERYGCATALPWKQQRGRGWT